METRLNHTDKALLGFLLDVDYNMIRVTGTKMALHLGISVGNVYSRLDYLKFNGLVDKSTMGVYILTIEGRQLAIDLKDIQEKLYKELVGKAIPKVRDNPQVAITWARIIKEKTTRNIVPQDLIDLVRVPDPDIPEIDKIIKGRARK